VSSPKDDIEMAKAIDERIIPVADPSSSTEPVPVNATLPDETKTPDEHESELGNVEDFEIDVPPAEGIAP
jgi:hypothetical protein